VVERWANAVDNAIIMTQQLNNLPSGLNAEDLVDIYANMVLIRTLDERIWAMNRQGKAAIVASSQGHEAAQLASVWALRHHAKDYFCFTYYRDLAVTVSQGLTPTEALLGFLAKEGEPMSGARQFPQHGAIPDRGVINISNVVATHIPQAVGWALAAKMRGEPTVVAAYMGDGATSQGEVHEAMNFASVMKLPVVFIVENNKYAISVPQHRQMNVKEVSLRAAGYGMPGVTVDGTDVVASYAACAEAVERAARGDGPSIVELDVERYLPHTSDDDDSVYRDKAEIDEARKRDPLAKLRTLLAGAGLMTDERDTELHAAARREVDAATDAAEAAPFPPDDDVFERVFEEVL
jgi:2-oxoisovalerate dehydrogenase E1 component alpha subunit